LGVGKASSRRFLSPQIAFSNSHEPSDFAAGRGGDAKGENVVGAAASGAEHQEARNDDSQNQMSVTLVHRLPRAPPDPLDLTIRSTQRPISLVRSLVAIDALVMARRARPCREVV